MLNTLVEDDLADSSADVFLQRHPLTTEQTMINGQVVEYKVSEYHDIFRPESQLRLSDARIPLGRISHLSDHEDDCPYLSTFRCAYQNAALEWMVGHLSFANWRVSSANPMKEEQLRICALAIFNAYPYLNLAEMVCFFGKITTYLSAKDMYVFGETQVMSALSAFCKERRRLLTIYDEEMRERKLEADRKRWRAEGMTKEEWLATPDGQAFAEDEKRFLLGRLNVICSDDISDIMLNNINKEIEMKKGDKGNSVKLLQRAINNKLNLGLPEDGIYGSLTEEAVRKVQEAANLKIDGIAGSATLAYLLKQSVISITKGVKIKKSVRSIDEIIIHCTATPEGREYSVDDIRSFHKANGWSDIGYHYIVHLDGRVEIGRDVDIMGAHTSGHNTHSIGVAYIGGCATDGKTPKDTRTPEQKSSLIAFLTVLEKEYPGAKICGHRDKIAEDKKKGKSVTHKACPCFDAKKEYADLC